MEANRSIRSYIGIGSALPLITALSLLAALVCLVFALRGPAGQAEPQEPMIFDARAALTQQDAADQSVYLDVLGISEELFRDGERGYFVAERAEHEYCLVCLSKGQIELLGAQREYWDGHSAVSLPFRLEGYRAAIPAAARTAICSTFEMDAQTFEANFGTLCFFDALPPVGSHLRPALLIPAIALFAVFLLSLCSLLLRLSSVANAMVRLEEADALGAAAGELDAPETDLAGGDRLRLGERYVFGWRNGLAADWKDLLWCCDKPFPSELLALRRMLLLGTADGKTHAVFFPAGAKKELRMLTERFAQKNPQLLQGADRKTREAFRARCRES